METKKCRICRQERDVKIFHKHSTAKDGRRAYCRHCASTRVRTYRATGSVTKNPYEKFTDRRIIGLIMECKNEMTRRGLNESDMVRLA